MILMYSEKGGYMNCDSAKEAIRASEKGWVPVPEKTVKKTRKTRSDSGKTRVKK